MKPAPRNKVKATEGEIVCQRWAYGICVCVREVSDQLFLRVDSDEVAGRKKKKQLARAQAFI